MLVLWWEGELWNTDMLKTAANEYFCHVFCDFNEAEEAGKLLQA